MHLTYTLVTPPAVEPVTRADAKLFARIDTTADDLLVDDLIVAARERCERVTGRALITQTWAMTLDQFPGALHGDPLDGPGFFAWGAGQGPIRLVKPPAQSVTSIVYLDGQNNQQTLDPSQYQVDVLTEPARILPQYGKLWPVTIWRPNAVTVTFVCGYGLAAAVPSEIKERIKAYVAYCYREREDADESFLDKLFARFSSGRY